MPDLGGLSRTWPDAERLKAVEFTTKVPEIRPQIFLKRYFRFFLGRCLAENAFWDNREGREAVAETARHSWSSFSQVSEKAHKTQEEFSFFVIYVKLLLFN